LAAARSADLEAIAHLSKALDLVGMLPDTPDHREEELALQMAIGRPLMATKGCAAPEVERTYSRVAALCDQLGRSAALFSVLRGLWNCYLVRGGYERDHDLAERLIVLAEDQGVPLRRDLARRSRLDEGITIDDAVQDGKRVVPISCCIRSVLRSPAGGIRQRRSGSSVFPTALGRGSRVALLSPNASRT
jgi:hypothetical protein